MKRSFSLLFLFSFLFMLASCTRKSADIIYINSPIYPTNKVVSISDLTTAVPSPTVKPTPFSTPVPATSIPSLSPTTAPDPLQVYIDSMPLKDKIGQLVMFGFSGTGSVSGEFKSLIREYHIGNVVLYGANIDRDRSDGGFSRCKQLTDNILNSMQSDIPPLISIDVEGGTVTRFQWPISLSSASSLGKKGDTSAAYNQFCRIGAGLAGCGINVDLAPVMDIAKKPSSTFLDTRIISSDPSVASEIGTACIQGLHDGGCLCFVKHFPGHGATTSDSHKKTPVIEKALNDLREYELIPFSAAVWAGTDGVMVGHLYYPKIDSKRIASQSPVLIQDILRNELGFDGIVMSDDFRMDGLRSQCSLKDAAVNFILAGGDLILCGANHSYQKEILTGLSEAVATGLISAERLNESVYRILRAKQNALHFTA